MMAFPIPLHALLLPIPRPPTAAALFDCVHYIPLSIINQVNTFFIVHNGLFRRSGRMVEELARELHFMNKGMGSSCMDASETSLYRGVGSKDHDHRTDQYVQHGDPEGEPL
jgi:hypothetical protein